MYEATGTDAVIEGKGVTREASLAPDSVSGERHAPSLATAGTRSTGTATHRATASVSVGAERRPRVDHHIRHRCRAILAASIDDLHRAQDGQIDAVLRGNALEDVRRAIDQLWQLRLQREEAFGDLINGIQTTLTYKDIAQFSRSQLEAIESALVRIRDEPFIDDEIAAAVTLELLQEGVDVFEALD